MSIFLLSLGVIILFATLIDILFTVLAPNGSGFITGKLSHWLWRLALSVTGHRGESKILSNIGVFILLFVVLNWVALLWIGNAIFVYADSEALYNSTQTAYKTDFISKLYFSGYVLSAMGHGDYSPASDWWKFYTAFISFTGVVFISLAISYLIPVIQAVTSKRSLSLKIAIMGQSPEDIITKNWKQDNFKFLITQINELRPSIFQLAQQHLAYPVIHYFHSTYRFESTSICIARIDETITILDAIMDHEANNELLDKIQSTRTAITYYLSTLKGGYINPSRDQPEIPKITYLDNHKIPRSANDDEIKKEFDKHEKRRKMLLAYVQNDAWTWDDVVDDHSEIQIE